MCVADVQVTLPMARPWYKRGGMHLHEILSAGTILGPWLVLASAGLGNTAGLALTILALAAMILVGLRTSDGRFFPAVVLPLYISSLLHVAHLPVPLWSMPLLIAGASVLGVARIGICMSVREAVHAHVPMRSTIYDDDPENITRASHRRCAFTDTLPTLPSAAIGQPTWRLGGLAA